MPAATNGVRIRHVAFITLALLINVIDSTLTRSAQDPQRQLILAIASSFDVVAVVLALYYWLLVRVRIRTKSSMIMIALLAMIRASFLFPDRAPAKTIIAAICELGFVGMLANFTSGKQERTPVKKAPIPGR